MRPALQVYGISTEDMDSLTFACPRLIRHLMAPVSQKQPVMEYDYDKARVCALGTLGRQAGAGSWRRTLRTCRAACPLH